jgi:hypothetical protein
MEGSCKYIEQAIADSQQRGSPPARGLAEGLTTSHCKKISLL